MEAAVNITPCRSPAVVVDVVLAGAALVVAGPAGTAHPSSACYGSYQYGGYITNAYPVNGAVGDINYNQGDMQLSDNSTDHAAMYVNATSQADPKTKLGYGWLQGGFFVGSADGKQTNTADVYGESYDLNSSPNANLNLYPSLGWGNRYFDVYYTGERGSNGRGLYYVTYGDGGTFLASSWLIDPYATQESATTEGYAGQSSSNCPKFVQSLFGTTGTAGQYDNSTDLYLWTNLTTTAKWTPGSFPSTELHGGPYSVMTYASDYAFDSSGGSG